MTQDRPTALDIGVVMTTGATALWAVVVLGVSVSRLDLLLTAVALGSLVACATTLAGLWHSPAPAWLQTAALVGCGAVTFSAGPYAFPLIGFVAAVLLVGLGVRRGEEQRRATDRVA